MPVKVIEQAIEKVDKNDIAQLLIEGCIVALGSNFEADKNLTTARLQLEAITISYQWSSAFVNPDYTATPTKPKPDYTNQCGYLKLAHPCSLQTLIMTCKQIEQSCERLVNDKGGKASNTDNSGQVSIDIDVLAVQVTNKWKVIAQRYPFKAHELIGIDELAIYPNCYKII